MEYTILIKRQAQKKLKSLSKRKRFRLTEKIMRLGQNPNDAELDIKPLQGEPFYRLRVGNWRIIFDKQDNIRIIAIEKLNHAEMFINEFTSD